MKVNENKTKILFFFPNDLKILFNVQLMITKLQTKYQIIPINTSKENFDEKIK